MSDRVRPEYRIRLRIDRPERARYERFLKYPTAVISDAFRKRQTLPPDIKPLYRPMAKVVGPAITVRATPGDEILALKAIEIAEPGDVIVVSGARSDRFSLWGGIMSTMAKVRGIAGLVTDGMVRDIEQTREVGLPVFCTGLTPAAPVMDVPPGELNLPISIGDVTVEPGDLVVGDEDGVVVVPRDELDAVAAAAEFRIEKEKRWLEEIHATRQMILKASVDALLAKRTVEYVE